MKIPIPAVVRQLGLLIRETVSIRMLVVNRITIVLLALLLLSGVSQAYITTNDDGRISGTVVGPDGEPVRDANVTMRPIGSETVGSENTTYTDDDGRFAFTDQARVLQFEISASKGGLGQSEVQRIHLYFRGQNTDVTLEIKEGSV
jgi:hypothetical protein